MAKKRKTKFASLSTPNLRQDASNYLVELAFLRQNHGRRLPPYFWKQTKYKFNYRREIQACRKFIKKYGEPSVIYIAIHNYIRTWTDFGRLEFLFQKYEESKRNKAAPKDVSPVTKEVIRVTEDYRPTSKSFPKKGVFEKLEELKKKYGEKENS